MDRQEYLNQISAVNRPAKGSKSGIFSSKFSATTSTVLSIVSSITLVSAFLRFVATLPTIATMAPKIAPTIAPFTIVPTLKSKPGSSKLVSTSKATVSMIQV